MKLKDLGIVDGGQINIDDTNANVTLTPVQVDVMKNNEITLVEDELDYNSIDEDEN